MTEKRLPDRSAIDSAKLWLEQRKQKPAASTPFAPHTPPAQRSISTFSSPGSVFAKDEDIVLIELTQRYLHAGAESESGPQCMIRFSPEGSRRIGDHRAWIPGYRRRKETLKSWGGDYELWRNDIVNLDLGLLSDMLERAVREAYNKYLLLDAGVGRLVLILPSLVPHPVLETILSSLFQRWKFQNITLLPSPATALVAAGLRSGLVVDIDWEETVVTSVYEYREVNVHRSTRATKKLTQDFATLMKGKLDTLPDGQPYRFDLDLIEDILARAMATIKVSNIESDALEAGDVAISLTDEPDIEIEWPAGASSFPVTVSKKELVSMLFSTCSGEAGNSHFDDHELPLPQLIYQALLAMSPDSRGVCMSRIVFTGQMSTFLPIRSHVLEQVRNLAKANGWTPVRGTHATNGHPVLSELAQGQSGPADAKHDHFVAADKDYVEEKLLKERAKSVQNNILANIREVQSLGSWAGASLLTSLKVRGFVEIDREQFLSHGFTGASRGTDISVMPQQRAGLALTAAGKSSDRNSWTLGGWG